MASKTLVLLGLLAIVLLISFEAAIASEHSNKKSDETTVEDVKYGGYPGGGYPGGGYPGGGYPGGDHRGPGGYPGRGGYCRWGCCYRDRYNGGACRRCCNYAGEKAQIENKPHN